MTDPTAVRRDYYTDGLGPEDLDPDPLVQFRAWLREALDAGIAEPNAMTVATVRPDGTPNARVLLLRGADGRGRAEAALEVQLPQLRDARLAGTQPRAEAGLHVLDVRERLGGHELGASLGKVGAREEHLQDGARRAEQLTQPVELREPGRTQRDGHDQVIVRP